MRIPVLDFFHLVQRISFNPTPDAVHKGPEVSEVLWEESLEIGPRQGTHGLAWTLCWCKRKLIIPRKNKAANEVQLGSVAPAMSKWSLYC